MSWKWLTGNQSQSATSELEKGLWGGVIVLGYANITAKREEADGSETEDLAELQDLGSFPSP